MAGRDIYGKRDKSGGTRAVSGQWTECKCTISKLCIIPSARAMKFYWQKKPHLTHSANPCSLQEPSKNLATCSKSTLLGLMDR